MEVLEAHPFGKGLEFIYRYKAVGSFFRRYNQYVTEAQDLGGFFEVTLKMMRQGTLSWRKKHWNISAL